MVRSQGQTKTAYASHRHKRNLSVMQVTENSRNTNAAGSASRITATNAFF
jgi:hypothetical protein